jgi:hypothetical protein
MSDVWVSVDERMPTRASYYFVAWIYQNSVVSGESFFDGNDWIFPHYGGDEKENPPIPPTVRYWMSIPLPPIELAAELDNAT